MLPSATSPACTRWKDADEREPVDLRSATQRGRCLASRDFIGACRGVDPCLEAILSASAAEWTRGSAGHPMGSGFDANRRWKPSWRFIDATARRDPDRRRFAKAHDTPALRWWNARAAGDSTASSELVRELAEMIAGRVPLAASID